MRKLKLSIILLVSLLLFVFCKFNPLQNSPQSSSYDNKVGMANPAAVYCKELGYTYKIITDSSGSQHGLCCFDFDNCSPDDKTPCTAWDFLKGKCGQKYSYCAKQGWDIKTVSDGKDPLSPEYAVCISKETKEEIGSVTQLMKLVEKSSKVTISPKPEETVPKLEQNSSRTFKKLPQKTFVESFGDTPSSFDWGNYNSSDWTTAVKDQGGCGACWSFSAVGTSEAAYDIGTNNPNYNLNLSEQYHVAGCDSPSGCQGCCGGWNDVALELIRDNGIPDDTCMPFVDGTSCSCSSSCASCTYRTGSNCSDRTCSDRCSDWASRLSKIDTVGTVAENGVTADRDEMKQYLMEKGPLSIAFDASSGDWYYDYEYENIVYYCESPVAADHAVVITGYDDNHGGDGFWIVKNSWGDDWGYEGNGYMKIIYGSCFIESSGVYYAEVDVTPTPSPTPTSTPTPTPFPVSSSPLAGNAIAANGSNGDLHLVVNREDASLYHTIRYSNGSWQAQGWADLACLGTEGETDYRPAVAYDSTNNKLHIVIVEQSNKHILHTVRNGDGSWQSPGWGDVTSALGGDKTTNSAPAVAINSNTGELHIAIKDISSGHILHTVRYSNGTWQFPGWGDVTSALGGDKTTIVGPAAAYDENNNNLQLLMIDDLNNHLLHTVRYSNGTWQFPGWGDVTSALGGDKTTVLQPSITSATGQGQVQIAIIDNNNHILHTVRYSNGTWQFPGWGDVTSALGGDKTTNKPVSLSYDSNQSQLHITMIDSAITHLFHTIRYNNGSWQATGWGDVTR